MEMLPVIALGIIILLGLVAMFMSHKTWPIYTIILLFFNMVAAAGFLYLGARTLKTYEVWRSEIRDWEKTVKDKSKEVEDQIRGGTQDVIVVNEEDRQAAAGKLVTYSMADLQMRLTKSQAFRGKIWGLLDMDTRNNLPAAPGAQPLQGRPPIVATISAMGNTVTADLLWNLPISPKDMGLEPKMLVYLFGDTQADPQAAGYFGKYLIDTVEPKGLKLTRTEQMLPAENLPMNARPVLIYNIFPNDDYRAFAGKTLAQLKQMPELRDVPDATLEQFIKHGKSVTAADEQALLQQNAIDDQAKNELSTLNKAQVWYRVRVKELLPYSEVSGKVAPAAAPAPMPGEDGNPMPMAEEALPATFGIGTKILLDPDTAKKLVDAGKAEYDGADYRVYMRPLRDYPSEYKRIRENFIDLTAAISEVDRLMALNAIAQKSTEETIKQHEARTALVNEDLGNLKKESAALTGYETQIKQRLGALRQERTTTLSEIGKLAATVTQIQLEALRKVNSLISAQDQAAAAP